MTITPGEFLFSFILFHFLLCLAFPFATLLHEIGHALGVILLTQHSATVRIGEGNRMIRFQFGRMQFKLNLSNSSYGFCEYARNKTTRLQQILIALAGPLWSLLFCILSLVFLLWVNTPLLGRFLSAVFLYANLYLFVCSTLPMHREKSPNLKSEWESDGYASLRMLKTEVRSLGK